MGGMSQVGNPGLRLRRGCGLPDGNRGPCRAALAWALDAAKVSVGGDGADEADARLACDAPRGRGPVPPITKAAAVRRPRGKARERAGGRPFPADPGRSLIQVMAQTRPVPKLPDMATWYPWILLVHLSCAIVFVGAVAFEVLVLEALHGRFEPATMAAIEQAVMARVRRFMPFVVVLLFASGGVLFDLRCDGFACVGTRLGTFLLLKVGLAFGVLGVFVNAVLAGVRGRMNACRFRHTHRVVLALMAGIVFLAKTMFYL